MRSKYIVLLLIALFVISAIGCARREGVRRRRYRAKVSTEITEEELAAKDIPLEKRLASGKLIDVAELKDVHFEFDQSRLLPFEKEILKKNAIWLLRHTNTEVQIEGHCDERGTREYNLSLGERRALSVRKYLVFLGVEPARLFTLSYGEEKPFDLSHNEEAWAKNRRAHLKIRAK